MSYIDEVIGAARSFDAERPRSTQSEVGWSEVGGCRARLGYRLAEQWPTDTPDTWAAQRGTAIHEYLQNILGRRPGTAVEVETSYRGIPGHADLVEKDPAGVTDIKSTRLANARLWAASPDVMRGKRMQAHGYAAGLVDAGELPGDCTVRLLVVPVDGTYDDWFCYEEPFDRALADEGADRLAWVRDKQAAGAWLPKDMPHTWCSSYCEFFTLCRGMDDIDPGELITDAELAAAIAKYGETTQEITALKKQQDGLADLVRGLRGVAGPWRIGMTRPGAPKKVLDEEAIRGDYATRWASVPEIEKPGAPSRLSVTRIKETKPVTKKAAVTAGQAAR